MKQVRFSLPPEITIQDTLLGIRKKIHLTGTLCLKSFRRFTECEHAKYSVYSRMCNSLININDPLRSQGVLPGDTLIVLPTIR